MSLKATWTKNDTGILRKNDTKEKREELFVFGYSCKLFRDDEKALHIDQGKHLIPWMGDETLKIDRYDARGALHNLAGLEAPPGGYDFRMELTRQELEVEQLCDEERYRAMHTDEDEEEMYKEEELKRLHAAGYGQVGFNYDAQAQASPAAIAAEVDEPFIVPEGLKTLLPADVVLPATEKLHAIIEKTAKFIASQGAQMEILLRAKQSDNTQFEFLNKDSTLHPYYEALTKLVKGGQWPEKKEVPVEIEEKHNDYEDYLHPSLASTIIEAAPSIPNIPYRWSAECDYSLLVSRVRGDEAGEAPPPPGTAPLPRTPPPVVHTEPIQHQHQPPPQQNTFYAASPMYYTQPPPPLPHQTGALPHHTGHTGALPHHTGTLPQHTGVLAQHTGALTHHAGALPHHTAVLPHQSGVLPHQTGVLPHQTGVLPHQTGVLPHQTGVLPHQTGVLPNQPGLLPHQMNSLQHPPPTMAVPKIVTSETGPKPMLAPGKSTGLNLMKNYASDSDSDTDSSTSSDEKEIQIKSPPEDVTVIIEKMSTYVARNGDEFADIVRAKNDPRFIFLEPTNEYHPFYLRMMREKRGAVTSAKVKKSIAPVSFSIKKQKEPDPVLPKPALPYESSEDEDPDKTTEPKNDVKQNPETVNLAQTRLNIVPTTVYKIESQGNNLVFPSIPKTNLQNAGLTEIAQNSIPNSVATENINKTNLDNNTIHKSPTPDQNLLEKPKELKSIEQKEVKNNGQDQKQDRSDREKTKDKSRDKERRRLKEDKYNHREDREDRKKTKKYKERSRSKRLDRSPDTRKDKRDKCKKAKMDDEIISLEDMDDELIDLTGDGPNDAKEIDSDIEKQKQMERRRRAAEFLKKVGVDPAAAALPTSSLASALVDTLKKRAEEEKRKKKEKRRRHKYEHNGDETYYKKSKRKKYEEDSSDHESKKKKKKKLKKRPTKPKKSKHQGPRESSPEELEEQPQDLPLSIDLHNTLRELRQTSPTRELELCGQNLPDVRHALSSEDESDTGRDENRPITDRFVDDDSQSTRASRKRKIRKEDREYSEGEWSSDSDSDSCTSVEKDSE